VKLLAQVDLPPNAPTLYVLLGRAYAWSGKIDSAAKNARAIDLLIQQHDVPALQALRYLMSAEIALAERKPSEAVDAAQKAVLYQNSAFAVETLARCYAAAQMPEKAAQEYEIVLTRANERLDDQRTESFDAPAFRRVVEIHYRLGVLYQKLGRVTDSRNHVQKFLGYWSNADAELGMYKDAQRLLRGLPATGTPTAAM